MIEVPVSLGELFDKISILEIKLDNIKCESKLSNVSRELEYLKEKALQFDTTMIQDHLLELKQINTTLWAAENKIRYLENQCIFDQRYIDTSICIRQTNDRRAAVKNQINVKLFSCIVEEKDHTFTDDL